jgi:predicted nucleotidyltransferase
MNIPQLVKEKILEIDENAQVILFGSRARGDFHGESD